MRGGGGDLTPKKAFGQATVSQWTRRQMYNTAMSMWVHNLPRAADEHMCEETP